MHARSQRFPLFDSLRAIAAISVLLVHLSGYVAVPEALRPYLARLNLGVVVFFLISGFLLYRPFVVARANNEPLPATGAYAWRRFLRIAPAYWLALTVLGLTIGLPGVTASFESVAIYYGFAQIYFPYYVLGGLFQGWSLCVEVAFYAFLPLYALALRGLPRRTPRRGWAGEAAGLAAIFIAAVAYKTWVLRGQLDQDRINEGLQELLYLPAFLDQFALGMGLAVLSVALAGRERLPVVLRPLDRFPVLGWLIALGSFWVVSTQIGLEGRGGFEEPTAGWQYFARHYLYALVGVGLLLPAVFGNQERGVVRRVLANPAFLYVGLVSYGVYLWHGGVLHWLRDLGLPSSGFGPLPAVLVWAVAGIAGSVAVASLSYWALERPLLRLKRLVPASRPMPGEPEPQASTVAITTPDAR